MSCLFRSQFGSSNLARRRPQVQQCCKTTATGPARPQATGPVILNRTTPLTHGDELGECCIAANSQAALACFRRGHAGIHAFPAAILPCIGLVGVSTVLLLYSYYPLLGISGNFGPAPVIVAILVQHLISILAQCLPDVVACPRQSLQPQPQPLNFQQVMKQ